MSEIKTWYSKIVNIEHVDNIETGSALRKYRKNLNISLRCLAKEMNYSASYISDLENGNRNWSKCLHDAFKNSLYTILIRQDQL